MLIVLCLLCAALFILKSVYIIIYLCFIQIMHSVLNFAMCFIKHTPKKIAQGVYNVRWETGGKDGQAGPGNMGLLLAWAQEQ